MTKKLTGRAASLKMKIDRLEQEDKLIRDAIGKGSGLPPNQTLAELRQELNHELSSKRIVILGTSHDAQKNGVAPLNSKLEKRLSFLAEKFATTALMEEWAEDQGPSFASTIANGLNMEYTDVGPPPEDQYRTFCNAPISYPAHDGTLGPCEDAPQFLEYGPLDKQENRELRMVQNVQNEMKKHQTGLFVVGLAHLHSISSKLRKAGFNVAAYSWIR